MNVKPKMPFGELCSAMLEGLVNACKEHGYDDPGLVLIAVDTATGDTCMDATLVPGASTMLLQQALAQLMKQDAPIITEH